jgi:cell division septal protein FtsQ
MTLLDIILILALGWVMGEFYTMYKLRKNLRTYIIVEETKPNVYKLETELVDDIILLYDRETNDFICQGKSLEQLAQLSREYKKIEYATVKHGDYFVAFIEGKVTEKV